MAVELKVPSVGESITEVFINRWLKGEGEYAEKDETVAELETDKATFELPAPVSGVVRAIAKKKGETAAVGEVIGRMDEAAAPAGKPATKPNGQTPEPKPAAAASEAPASRVMPAAQRVLAEKGLTSEQVKATGPGGRLLKEDVARHTPAPQHSKPDVRPIPAAAPPPPPVVSGPREEQAVAMSPMRQTIARRLVEAQHNAALLTTFNEVDMSGVAAIRKKYQDAFVAQHETKLGFMSFFVKAVVDALLRFPAINAEIRENKIIYKNYCDIGMAVSTPKGLVVPVVRNAESLSFAEIEKAVLNFGQRGKENKIDLKDLEGGTFTITNGGIFGSLLSTPIINPPQSGVLGLHAIQDRVVVVEGQMAIRPMMYIALTYDHRIVDGREAVGFLKRVKECIEDPTRMLMEV